MKPLRRVLRACVVALAAAVGVSGQSLPISGVSTPSFSGVDTWTRAYMQKYAIPGGAVAVVQNGNLLYARGFGYQDVEANTPVEPATLFRIASLSKPITATAILKLLEQGKLRLDDRAFDVLSDLRGPSGGIADERVRSITIEQLLHHSGGWDLDLLGFDPMFQAVQTSAELNVSAPATCQDVIRRMLGRSLSFAPGTRYSYSNFGYCILGRVIERVTQMPYEQFVRQEVLAPMGISSMRIGRTLLEGRAAGESRYHMPLGSRQATSVFPPVGSSVPWPYGGWHLEAMDSHGGWIASAPDLARFLTHLDGQRGAPILNSATWALTSVRPPSPVGQGTGNFYGLGWDVNPGGGRANYFHGGSLDGTTTFMVKLNNGVSWVALFNIRPSTNANYFGELDSGLNRAVGEALAIPAPVKDEFASFLAPTAVSIRDREGVINAASFTTAFAPGSWVTIAGRNLSPSTRIWRTDEFIGGSLPKSLDGVSVLFNGSPASVYFVSPEQINVQAPANTGSGPVKVEVIRDGIGRDVRMGDLRQNAPALFTYAAANVPWAAAVHLDGAVAGPESVPGTRIVRAGDRLLLFGTGFGPSPAGISITAPVTLVPMPTVELGGQALQVEYAGYVSAGLLQINVLVPESFSATGDLELRARWGSPLVPTQSGVRLPVRQR